MWLKRRAINDGLILFPRALGVVFTKAWRCWWVWKCRWNCSLWMLRNWNGSSINVWCWGCYHEKEIAWDSFFCRLRELTSLTRRSEEMLKYNVILSTSARVKILFSFAIMVNLSQYECLSEEILKTRTNIDGKCGYKQYKNSWILNWRIYCDEIEVGSLK